MTRDGDALAARLPISPGVRRANPALFGPAPAPVVASKHPNHDWPESCEYSGTCRTCKAIFFGPKWRIQGRTCRQCAETPEPKPPKAAKPRRAREPNATEREYEAMLRQMHPAAVIKWETYTLRLANRVTYTPDYSILQPSGQLDFYEVKGPYVYPKALVKPRLAAVQFPQHSFTIAQKKKTGWEITTLSNK